MNRVTSRLVQLVLLAFFVLFLAPVEAQVPQESYYGIYLGPNKLGHVYVQKLLKTTWQGKPATKTVENTRMNLVLEGVASVYRSNTTTYADPKTGATLAEELYEETAGKVTQVKATYTKRSVTYQALIQGTTKTGTLTLGPNEDFVKDPSGIPGKKPIPGTHLKGKVFRPLQQALEDLEVHVRAKAPVRINGLLVPAYKIETLSSDPTTSYVDESGETLMSVVALEMQVRREPKSVALAQSSQKAIDLAAAIGTRPTGISLEEIAHKAQVAVYELSHVTRALPPTDSVQRIEEIVSAPPSADNSKTLKVTITSGPLPEGPTTPLFARRSDAPTRLQAYLRPTAYAPCDDPGLVALARQAIGKEKDAARVADLLVRYVNHAIKPDASMAVARTARDIQKDPRGVCRDYTTYFATLARAVGLPTKECAGLVYDAGSGLFVYHAWPEVWIGTDSTNKDRWFAVEPTWGAPFASATHLKLVEGTDLDITKVAADMGKYAIKVISAQ